MAPVGVPEVTLLYQGRDVCPGLSFSIQAWMKFRLPEKVGKNLGVCSLVHSPVS